MDKAKNSRAALLESGVTEISKYGIRGFSLRRVASRCGVSCAAPYKHFDGKEHFLSEIFREIAAEWHRIQHGVLSEGMDPARQLGALVREYIIFMADNPGYANLIVMNDPVLGDALRTLKVELTEEVRRALRKLCDSLGLSDDDYHRKLFALRTSIYGAVVMMTADGDDTYSKAEVIRLMNNVMRDEFSINT